MENSAAVSNFSRQSGNALRLLAVVLLGLSLALLLYEAWDLETRWLVLVVVTVAGMAISLCLVRIFSDFLLVCLLFCIPIASFSKWFLYEDIYAGALGLGPVDLLVGGLYFTWFYRVFISREQPTPRFARMDLLVLWLILAHAVSILGSAVPAYGIGATSFVIEHALIYFYLSQHVNERMLPWVLVAFAATVFLEFLLSSYQFSTGHLVGIAVDRGAGTSQANIQYHVPGTGSYFRASGTSYDAHSLGHLMALIAPFPLVLFLTPRLQPLLRLGAAVVAAAALVTVLMTLSRSAWFSCAIGLAAGTLLIIAIWREREVVVALAGAFVGALLIAPFVSHIVYDRLANAPSELVSYRFEQYEVGWYVITLFPIFGVGPGNWMQAFRIYDFNGVELLPLHNVILYITAEIGFFGLFAYLSVFGLAMLRFLGAAVRRRDIPGRLAMAGLISLVTFMFDGLTDPTFREPNVYFMLWVLISLSVVLPRLREGACAYMLLPPRLPSGVAPAGVRPAQIGARRTAG